MMGHPLPHPAEALTDSLAFVGVHSSRILLKVKGSSGTGMAEQVVFHSPLEWLGFQLQQDCPYSSNSGPKLVVLYNVYAFSLAVVVMRW